MTLRRPLLAIAIATFVGLAAQDKQVHQLSAAELKTLLKKNPRLFFLDVREPKEIEQLGTIRGYVNIPVSQLEKRYSEIPKEALVVTA